jgi:hypothetical protein
MMTKMKTVVSTSRFRGGWAKVGERRKGKEYSRVTEYSIC